MATKLKPEELYRCCDVSTFTFTTTNDLQGVAETIGQERALTSLDFGLSLTSRGFNIFALGESGTGKMRAIRKILEDRASKDKVPDDWCYVYNFKDPDAPMAIPLAPGQGTLFQKDMDDLVTTLRAEIPKVFESKEYERQRSKVVEDFQLRQKELFAGLEQEAESKGFAIRKAVAGLVIVPIKKTGEPLTEEDFAALSDKTKKEIESIGKSLQEKLDDVVRAVRAEEKKVKDMLAQLDRGIGLASVGHLIDDIEEKYKTYPKITAYLKAVQEDILSHLEDFKTVEEQAPPLPFMKMPKPEVSFSRYSINVIVNNGDCKGAPVVIESNPTYLNLFGRIEYKVQYGMATTDFTMIRGGALHKANGGYLVISALDLLKNIFSYDGLKRAIKNGEIRLEDIWEQYRLISTTTLKPEAMPLDVKIILTGPPMIYYLLHSLDEEYKELFKVKADFDSRMELNSVNIQKYANFIAKCQKEEKLLPFDRSGVSRIVEYGSRLAGEQDKISTKFSEVADLLRESSYWAKKDGGTIVTVAHVKKAIDEKIYRVSRIEDRLREMMLQDTLIVETSGSKVGQINGLAVLSMGDHTFGKPSRITARTFMGKAGIVNIERETKMSGKIHEKAIFILSSYIGSKYAIKRPISLSASLTFEQLYEMVEGDSATCAELYALLSSISNVPIKQNFAVTGSMDQNGDVQPIGGVNEKIEGFFDLCKMRGLDGTQGVIIPKRNVRNLMVRDEVVQAVKESKFSIYPIDKVEEGLEILTGMPVGIVKEDGTYPEGTINSLIAKRLEEMAEAIKGSEKAKDESEKSNLVPQTDGKER